MSVRASSFLFSIGTLTANCGVISGGTKINTVRVSGGGSDASYTTMRGIPTLDSLGVASKNIHSKDEYTLISSLIESAKGLAAICCYM